jgi:hypothetical protein
VDPIQFNQAAWPNTAADDILQIIPYDVNGVTHYRILVGQVQRADGLLAGDPTLVLAQQIRALLPNELQDIATQRHNFGQAPAFHFQPPPPPQVPKSED